MGDSNPAVRNITSRQIRIPGTVVRIVKAAQVIGICAVIFILAGAFSIHFARFSDPLYRFMIEHTPYLLNPYAIVNTEILSLVVLVLILIAKLLLSRRVSIGVKAMGVIGFLVVAPQVLLAPGSLYQKADMSYQRGMWAMKNMSYSTAVGSFREVLSLNLYSANAVKNHPELQLGYSLVRLKKTDEARAHFDHLLYLYRSNDRMKGWAYLGIAQCDMAEGDYATARNNVTRAIGLGLADEGAAALVSINNKSRGQR